eukprot:gene8801-6187_t
MYRNNVCAIIFNEEGKVLACRRRRAKNYQFVQGGVEQTDPDIVEAALREIHEEVGLQPPDVTFVAEVMPPSGNPAEFRYELAPSANLRRYGYVGQQQRMLLFYASSAVIDKVVLIPPPELKDARQEFDAVEWMTFEDLLARGHPAKLGLFQKLATLSPPLIQAFVQQGAAPPA